MKVPDLDTLPMTATECGSPTVVDVPAAVAIDNKITGMFAQNWCNPFATCCYIKTPDELRARWIDLQ